MLAAMISSLGLVPVAHCAAATALCTPSVEARCIPPVCHQYDRELRPSTTSGMEPMAVVTAQLQALQRGEVKSCFDFSSSRLRRVTGPRDRFEKVVRERPEYKPLVESSGYEVLSTLSVTPRRWRCRVRVDNAVGRVPYSTEYRFELTRHAEAYVA